MQHLQIKITTEMIKILSLVKLIFILGRFSRNACALPLIASCSWKKKLFLLNILILDFTHEAVGEKIVRTFVCMSCDRSNRRKDLANSTRLRRRVLSFAVWTMICGVLIITCVNKGPFIYFKSRKTTNISIGLFYPSFLCAFNKSKGLLTKI